MGKKKPGSEVGQRQIKACGLSPYCDKSQQNWVNI